MNGTRLLGVILLVGGILALLYGGFSYTKDTDTANIGPLKVQVSKHERVNIPLWAGIAAMVAGGVLMVAPGRARD